MPSNAYKDYLEPLLADAKSLNDAHTKLATGNKGRQWGLAAINRAMVVMSVSAWEAYIEALIKEAIESMRPVSGAVGNWPALKGSAYTAIGRFNNPNVERTTELFSQCLGLQDVTATWGWKNCTRTKARSELNKALDSRHKIAHGEKPRPVIHNNYSGWLQELFRNLGRCTDAAVLNYLVKQLRVPSAPW